ncbi:MAG TPA: ABC transporter permease [Bryobacteraceae bacterium]
MTWWNRLRHKTQMDEELDKELRFHIDQHTDDLVANGHDREQARRQARLALGGPEQLKEDCRDARGMRWLVDLWQDFHYALRTLRQNPGFAAVALLTLGLGSGATTVMFTLINSVLLKPLAYAEPERLVTIHTQNPQYGDSWGVSHPDFLDCRKESQSFAYLAAWRYGRGTISEPGEPANVDGREISADLFSVFGVRVELGRAFRRDEDRPGGQPVIIINDGLWRRRFAGKADVLGKRVVIDGKSWSIVGIAPPGFELDGKAEVFTPLGQDTGFQMQNRAATILHLSGRLRPGVTIEQAQAELARIGGNLAAEYPKSNAGSAFVAHRLLEETVGNAKSTLWLLFGAVGMVLLMACVNVASLLLARAVSRDRELAMRAALGAGRGRLVRQCLTESAFLGLAGGLLGMLIAVAGVRPFMLLWPEGLPRAAEVRLDWHVLLFALAVSLLSGFIFGLAPALRTPARQLEQTLRAGARSVTGSARRLHSGFVGVQIALAVVLLVSAGLLGHTLLRLSALSPGFDVHNVLVAHAMISPGALSDPARMRASWVDFLRSAQHLPGVQSAALADTIPMRVGLNELGYWTTPAIPPLPQQPLALATVVTPNYLSVMGIPLRRGRFFDEHDRLGSEHVVVIDEVMAQHAFKGQDPVGKFLWIPYMFTGPIRVVGVVGHVRHWGLAADDSAQVRDQIYYPLDEQPDVLMGLFSSVMSIVVRTNVPPMTVLEPLKREVRGVTGDQVLYGINTMEQLASSSLERQRFLLLLFGVFAGMALLLACVGIYGVLAYLTSRRTPEIGVRMALGANGANVMRLVLGQSLGMIVVGAVLGIAAATAAARILERLVAGVQGADPLTVALMMAVLTMAALAASFIPARRASHTDPMSALRQE